MKRFYQIRPEMEEQFDSGNLEAARKLAEEYLQLAAQNLKDWNYGNAIHHANIFLGRIALLNGKLSKAKEHLLAAGSTKRSPQLYSFGPNMTLARDLLLQGEKEIVLQYIDMCKSFWWLWVMHFRTVHNWKRQIKQGEIPDFKAHLLY